MLEPAEWDASLRKYCLSEEDAPAAAQFIFGADASK